LQVERQRAAIALLTTSVAFNIGNPTARLVLDMLAGNDDEAVTAMGFEDVEGLAKTRRQR